MFEHKCNFTRRGGAKLIEGFADNANARAAGANTRRVDEVHAPLHGVAKNLGGGYVMPQQRPIDKGILYMVRCFQFGNFINS